MRHTPALRAKHKHTMPLPCSAATHPACLRLRQPSPTAAESVSPSPRLAAAFQLTTPHPSAARLPPSPTLLFLPAANKTGDEKAAALRFVDGAIRNKDRTPATLQADSLRAIVMAGCVPCGCPTSTKDGEKKKKKVLESRPKWGT